MPDPQNPRIAFISSYLPRKCGIATFTNDLATAIAVETAPTPTERSMPVVAMSDRLGEYDYGPDVLTEVFQPRRDHYRNAAEVINTSRIDYVSLQHEYGLFGGTDGAYVVELLDQLEMPVVTTLHTVLSQPSDSQRSVLTQVCRRSASVVVMADRAKSILHDVYGVEHERVEMIHHGVPDLPFGDTEPFKARFGLSGRPMILTFGLLSPGKGIETMLDAMSRVVVEHPDAVYVILGETHPGVRRDAGELYRISLERQAVELGIEKNVQFHNRYVSKADLREYLLAADCYATPYRAKEQITSGTLAYALAAGKAVVSTPYWHAQELLAGGRGKLVDFGDADGFAGALCHWLSDRKALSDVQRAAYDFGRTMTWSTVAKRYVETFQKKAGRVATSTVPAVSDRKVLMRLSLPELHLKHFFAMTDDTGMLQHARYCTPDRVHGYCTDDNARALIVSAMSWTLFRDERVIAPLRTYLSFLSYAQDRKTGRFKNFMSYDRRWLEDAGSDDSQGRAIWALGYLVAHAPSESLRALATDMLQRCVGTFDALEHTLSWAFSILGLHYYLRHVPGDEPMRTCLNRLAGRLERAFAQYESEDWLWCEDALTYDNARVPQALIIAGTDLNKKELTSRGVRSLRWLVELQTTPRGRLSIIGCDGWYVRGGERARFDQQPLEPAALIGACKAAFRATEDATWLGVMRRCFEWYVGRNDLELPMVDFKSRGCYDGLQPGGVNQNQGAESLVSWLLSLLIMHEMQTGDVIDVG